MIPINSKMLYQITRFNVKIQKQIFKTKTYVNTSRCQQKKIIINNITISLKASDDTAKRPIFDNNFTASSDFIHVPVFEFILFKSTSILR